MEFAGVRQSITNCISTFIQCEDWMLTGPTYKRVPFNRPRSTNKTSRRFDFPNSSITALESSLMIEIGEKIEGGRGLRRRGWAIWSGVFPSTSPVRVCRVWGGGCAPSAENFWDFCLKMAHFGCIFCHTRDFFAVQRRGHGPSGPMVNTPMISVGYENVVWIQRYNSKHISADFRHDFLNSSEVLSLRECTRWTFKYRHTP